jgi:hypothetical protein
MTRIAVSAAALLMVATSSMAHAADEADTPDEIQQSVELEGALNTLHEAGYNVDAATYLTSEKPVAAAVVSVCGWPICGSLGQRIYCVEGIESTHGRAMYNPIPVGREHAQGWLGFLPSTAARWGVVIGNRSSEWSGASRMITAGAGGQFAGIAWGRC